jgi:hypothetical protein
MTDEDLLWRETLAEGDELDVVDERGDCYVAQVQVCVCVWCMVYVYVYLYGVVYILLLTRLHMHTPIFTYIHRCAAFKAFSSNTLNGAARYASVVCRVVYCVVKCAHGCIV